MKSRTPSVNRICAAALRHFSVQGYDASSMNAIAEIVGIRKASLYSHFKNKDALFLQALSDAVSAEKAHAEEVFTGFDTNNPGAIYIAGLEDWHVQSVHLRFLLRAVFHHPLELKTAIGEVYESFLFLLRMLFTSQLRNSEAGSALSDSEIDHYGHAYVGIVESLFVELNFAGIKPMQIRREALWQLLKDSLSLKAIKPREYEE